MRTNKPGAVKPSHALVASASVRSPDFHGTDSPTHCSMNPYDTSRGLTASCWQLGMTDLAADSVIHVPAKLATSHLKHQKREKQVALARATGRA
jgi:hypothetical protein